MKKVIFIFGVVFLVVTFYFSPFPSDSNDSHPKANFKLVKAVKGDLVIKVSAKGIVEPNFQVEVKSKASGKVLTFSFKEGDYIKKGEGLLQLNKTDETRNVAKAKADLMSSEASLKKAETSLLLQKTRYETDLKRTASEVEEAQANLRESEEKKIRQTNLFHQQITSRESFENAVTIFKVNQESLIQAEASFQAAQNAIHDIDMKKHEVELAKAEVKHREITLDEVNERLNETDIYSPITGVIIQKLVEEGQIISSGISNVSGGTALAEIADMSRMFITADVDETDIGAIHVGQNVEVTADAFYGKNFGGKVLRISPKGIVENSITVFKVKIEILGKGKKILKPMMTANVDIITNKVKNTIYISREAVRRDGDTSYAMILKVEVPNKREIKVGIQTPIYSEIISGLENGQEVVVGDWEKQLADAANSVSKGSSLKKILWMLRSK